MSYFETSLEKLARILTSQFGVNVVFEGNQAFTDGETITLPNLPEMTPELRKDMNGFLDHEVAHCRYTTFDAAKGLKNKFAWHMMQSTEDSRINKLMIRDFPGSVLHLDPLYKKYRGEIHKNWKDIPWQSRVIISYTEALDGAPQMKDPEIEPYLEALAPLKEQFRNAPNTNEIVRLSTEAARLVKETAEREEEKKKQKSKGGGSEGEKSEGDEDGEGMEGTTVDSFSSDKAGDKKKGKGKKGDPKKGHDLTDSSADFSTEYSDMESYINKRIADNNRKFPNVYRPVTTKFDVVTDHSGEGNYSTYTDTKAQVSKIINPTRSKLERILKVKENAKWKHELERGTINARALAGLASTQGYRTPFKQFVKTETNNVAVSIVVDLSGSMGGSKINQARLCTVALAESLKALNIKCEVTGFTTVGSHDVSKYAQSIKAKETQFERMNERLDLRVFKSFDSENLNGLTQIRSMSNNTDGESISWAAKRLSFRKEKRKILLVLSDGNPAHDGSYEALSKHLRDTILSMSKFNIEAIGIGIQSDHVKEYYPDFVVVNNVSELPTKALSKIGQMLLR